MVFEVGLTVSILKLRVKKFPISGVYSEILFLLPTKNRRCDEYTYSVKYYQRLSFMSYHHISLMLYCKQKR